MVTLTIPQIQSPILGQRHLQVFLLFLSIIAQCVAKFNISVAVVAMTNAGTTNPNFTEYYWTEMEKSYILSSFFFGNFITQFPGGYLCRRFGAKRTMLVSTFGSAVFAILPPFVVSCGGWRAYCGIRVIIGLFQGLLFPCIHALLAAWCPVNERNRLGALAHTSIPCGILLATFLSGTIAASNLGWPGISYLSGVVGLAWCILWMIYGSNSPKESHRISQAELNYIETSKNTQKAVIATNEPERKVPVPWKAIWTSHPFWVLMMVHLSVAWSFSTLQTEIPFYMNGVLRMDIKSNALYSALPYLAMLCMSFVFILAADILISRQILSLTAIRKTFNSLAFCVPAICLIGIGFVGEDQKALVIILMTVTMGISAGATIGSGLNTIDLSPNYAAILMGIVNTPANIIPMLTPLLVGIIVQDESDRTQWQIVFIIAAVVLVAGNLYYIIFGQMHAQPWNDKDFLTKHKDHNEDSKKKNAIEAIQVIN